MPPKVLTQVNKLESDALNHDRNANNAMLVYNQLMAQYALTGKKSDYDNAQQNLKKAQDEQKKAADLRQQEATLLGPYNGASYEDHSRGYNGIYGGFVARTIKVENKTHVHYDETLRTAGPVNHYEIVNWFEDDLSRNSAGGPETFWW